MRTRILKTKYRLMHVIFEDTYEKRVEPSVSFSGPDGVVLNSFQNGALQSLRLLCLFWTDAKKLSLNFCQRSKELMV